MNETFLPTDNLQPTSTEEFENLRFRLRDDLEFSLQAYGGDDCYVVEDAANHAYFRIRESEYRFLSLLNGKHTVAEAVSLLAAADANANISEKEAYVICRWLADNQLVDCSQGFSAEIREKHRNTTQRKLLQQVLNPLSVSITLGDPRTALRWLYPVLGRLYQPVGWLFWLVVLTLGGICFLVDYERIWNDPAAVIAPSNWFWFALAGAFCKIAHETSHGLCALHYGGAIKSFGLNLVMFFPIPFVDASSIWRLPSKWKRIHVAFAGVYIELLLAATAAVVHSFADDASVRLVCLNIMLTGGLLTMLVNLNPFLRYDGYFILSDWLEYPNLGPAAAERVQALIKRLLCGVRSDVRLSRRAELGLFIYGCMCGACRISIAAAMIWAAHRLFAGAGLVLAFAAAMAWFVVPLGQALQYVVVGRTNEFPSRFRMATILTSFGLCFWLVGTTVPIPETLELPGIVDFVPTETVRCRMEGFVARVGVAAGERVCEGEVLVELANPNILYDLDALEIELKQLACRRQWLQCLGDIASIAVVDGGIQSQKAKQSEKRVQAESLIIRAPCDGVVIASEFESLPGKFLSLGEVVCVIGDPARLGVQVMIPQSDIAAVSESRGSRGRVRFVGAWGQEQVGTLVDIEPRATSELIHAALAATAGGPLAVRRTRVDSDEESLVLADPHFVGKADISDSLRAQCASGQVVGYQLTCRRHTLLQKAWNYLYQNLR